MARRRKATRRRSRRGGSGTSIGATALGAVTGGVAAAVEYAVGSNETMAKAPWLVPAALIVGGHIIKRRPRLVNIGAAMVGAGGYALGQQYIPELAESLKGEDKKTKVSKIDTESNEATGLYGYDTGMLITPDDYQSGMAGYLSSANDPTSAHYVGGDEEEEEADVSSAMAL